MFTQPVQPIGGSLALSAAVTGSDTSSNSLFGLLQVTAASHAGLGPVLMASANSPGDVMDKVMSPQNLAVAAAVSTVNRKGGIFRRRCSGASDSARASRFSSYSKLVLSHGWCRHDGGTGSPASAPARW